jgi:hypothetical protein
MAWQEGAERIKTVGKLTTLIAAQSLYLFGCRFWAHVEASD